MALMTPIAARGGLGDRQIIWGVSSVGGVAALTLSSPGLFFVGDVVFVSPAGGAPVSALGRVLAVSGTTISVRTWGGWLAVGGWVWRAAALWQAVSVPAGSDWGAGRDEGIERLDTTGGGYFTRSRNAREMVRVILGNVAVADWVGWRNFLVGQASGGMGCFTGVWADKDSGGIRLAKVRVETPERELAAKTVGYGRRAFELDWEIIEEGTFY